MATLEEAWKFQEDWPGDHDSACLLDLRARVEALEQRAATEESSATEPAPAPAADGPLWAQMEAAYGLAINHPATSSRYAAEIDAVADWLDKRYRPNCAELLRTEARRAREGA